MLSNIQAYNKAIVVLIVGLIIYVAGQFGLQFDSEVQLALTSVITALVVFAVPNRPAK